MIIGPIAVPSIGARARAEREGGGGGSARKKFLPKAPPPYPALFFILAYKLRKLLRNFHLFRHTQINQDLGVDLCRVRYRRDRSVAERAFPEGFGPGLCNGVATELFGCNGDATGLCNGDATGLADGGLAGFIAG